MKTLLRRDIEEAVFTQVNELRSVSARSFCGSALHREISLPQLQLLITLRERGRMTVTEIASLFDISMPSSSSIIDRMEERGLVIRTRDGEDRRVVTVEASPHGSDLAEEFIGIKRVQLQRLIAALSDRELDDLNRGLDALKIGLSRITEG